MCYLTLVHGSWAVGHVQWASPRLLVLNIQLPMAAGVFRYVNLLLTLHYGKEDFLPMFGRILRQSTMDWEFCGVGK